MRPTERKITNPRVTVLICTLNEEENLAYVLPRIPSWVDELLIVDGRSTDGTVETAKKLQPGVRILHQPGRGKGDALKFGVKHALGDIVVTLDADGETDPADLRAFVTALRQKYDLAKGSRLADGRPKGMPLHRWIGNRVLAFTYNFLYGEQFTDVCSGYNAFWKRTFQKLTLTCSGCEMEQQMLARAEKAGMRIVEVPHHSDGRIAGTSKVSSIRQGFIDLLVIIRERFIA
jgi:glycosyltransferase involved in cell wall biosynthesis